MYTLNYILYFIYSIPHRPISRRSTILLTQIFEGTKLISFNVRRVQQIFLPETNSKRYPWKWMVGRSSRTLVEKLGLEIKKQRCWKNILAEVEYVFFRNHRFISDVFFVGDSVCLIHLLDAEMWICTALIVHIFLSHVLSTPLCLFLKRIPTPPCKILFLRGAGLWLFSRSLIKILFHLVDGRKPCTNCHVWILRRGLPGPPCSSDCWSPSPSSQVAKTLVN